MPNYPFRTTPSLGPDLWQVVKANQVWYEGAGRGAAGADQVASPQTGTTAFGTDGHEYMWVQASGAITVAASGEGTQLALTLSGTPGADPFVTAIAGAGGWYAPTAVIYPAPGTIATGDRFWARKGVVATP